MGDLNWSVMVLLIRMAAVVKDPSLRLVHLGMPDKMK